jgi:hypothetical protein
MLWEVADFKGRPGNVSMAVEVINEVLLGNTGYETFPHDEARRLSKITSFSFLGCRDKSISPLPSSLSPARVAATRQLWIAKRAVHQPCRNASRLAIARRPLAASTSAMLGASGGLGRVVDGRKLPLLGRRRCVGQGTRFQERRDSASCW